LSAEAGAAPRRPRSIPTEATTTTPRRRPGIAPGGDAPGGSRLPPAARCSHRAARTCGSALAGALRRRAQPCSEIREIRIRPRLRHCKCWPCDALRQPSPAVVACQKLKNTKTQKTRTAESSPPKPCQNRGHAATRTPRNSRTPGARPLPARGPEFRALTRGTRDRANSGESRAQPGTLVFWVREALPAGAQGGRYCYVNTVFST
jgi:hypothetical protein